MATTQDRERDRRQVLIEMLTKSFILVANLGDNPEVTFVALAIRLGWLKREPLDVSALAASLQMPRSTVIRHLKALEARNRIAYTNFGKRRVPLSTGMDEKLLSTFLRNFKALVAITAHQLSILDR